jgi:Arc/MetJ-type ribon-helix-helix transcriptional regulator
MVHHARANGDRRANRSSIIRDALKRLLEFTARGGKWRSK